MGGFLSVESRLGEGSRFAVSLPLVRGQEPQRAEAQVGRDALAGHILAVDDNRTNRTIIQALLEPLGLDVSLAADGEEALAKWEAERFDLILMDVQMPGLDGLAATRAIRAIESARGLRRTPILALTANVMGHQIEAYAAAGMDGHIGKPFEATALIQTLFATLEANSGLQQPPHGLETEGVE